jgi:hypothetical protein
VKRAIPTCVLMAMMGIVGVSSINAVAGTNHYRWIDERGNPVHSDRAPPKGVDYEVITTGSSLVRQVEAEEGAVPAEVDPRVGNDFEPVNTKPKGVEKNPEYCKRAQDNFATLNIAPRIRIRNDQGEYHYLTDDEKKAEQTKAQDAIKLYCE